MCATPSNLLHHGNFETNKQTNTPTNKFTINKTIFIKDNLALISLIHIPTFTYLPVPLLSWSYYYGNRGHMTRTQVNLWEKFVVLNPFNVQFPHTTNQTTPFMMYVSGAGRGTSKNLTKWKSWKILKIMNFQCGRENGNQGINFPWPKGMSRSNCMYLGWGYPHIRTIP